MKLELISFALCPYVQRSVITLKTKKVPFEITYIDLENPPRWFHEISPLGQVPVLKVDDREILFESAVINEFIDETTEPKLLPKDPLARAKQRAWIEYGSVLLREQYVMSTGAETAAEAEEARKEFFDDLGRLESVVVGPYFTGSSFGLIDTAYAPIFMRLRLHPDFKNAPELERMPRVRAWGDELLKIRAVQESVRPDFEKEYLAAVEKRKRGRPS